MSDIRIIQGNQIGGCVTVISTVVDGITHRIMIDYGSSLPGSSTVDFKYPWDEEPVDAVFFTHYHGDHVGRLMEIKSDVPIYMGSTARQVMLNIQKKLSQIPGEEGEKHKAEAALLSDDSRIRTFERYENRSHKKSTLCKAVTDIPGFRIEPYSVDHSAYDAYMYLIEADDPTTENGKRVILHTGDFRGHGRLGKAMMDVIKKFVHRGGRKVNSLIIEGTMMTRRNEKVLTESQMKLEATDYLRKHKYAFLICSSTNLDSLASFYHASQDAAKPPRYFYTSKSYYAEQLKTFSATAGAYTDVYKFKKVYTMYDLNELMPKVRNLPRMTRKQLMERRGFLAMISPENGDRFIDPFIQDFNAGLIDQKPVIIYSMWDGYIKEKLEDKNGQLRENKAKKQEWMDFLKRQEERGIEVKHLHTSGHATAAFIAGVIKAVAPTDEIRPIHTESPDSFKELDIGEYADKVVF